MSQSDTIADALASGPVNIRKEAREDQYDGEQLVRFYDQAHRLGKCAKLVYPKDLAKEDKPEIVKRVEELMERWKDKDWDDLVGEIESESDAEEPSQRPRKLGQRLFPEAQLAQERERDHFENELDGVAAALRRSYRKAVRNKYLYPWGWFSAERLREVNRAKEKWSVAHELWVQEARQRIEQALKPFVDGGGKVKFVSHDGTEYFLAADRQLIVLSFRGTEARMGDILTDLLSWQTKEEDGKAKFHNGFWCALDGIWEELRKSLTTSLAEPDGFRYTDQPDAQQIWITGHSLGGALATLAAYRIARESNLKPDSKELPQIAGVFTFGQPRVGDRQFAREYKSFAYQQSDGTKAYLNDRHFRFVNNNDVVTVIPPKPFWIVSVLFGRALSMALPAKKNGVPTTPDAPMTTPDAPTSASSDQTEGKIEIRVDSSHKNQGNQQWTSEYSHVGRVVMANRSNDLRLLTPDQSLGWRIWKSDFWWLVSYQTHRIGSWQLFRLKPCGGFMKRFLPGIPDHFMDGYVDVLNSKREQHASSGTTQSSHHAPSDVARPGN